ncbi:hypothetical protein J5N97_012812 [Dioscorea zingiberensis]|uniref:Uncharacterized protein n=1 Tax=Dioscorea zingiberensis TaxID=325984 RepID=A0A9D5CPN0_9LILI|nr:hypothetical protein J5N97_012812 [Dioscorea zingiberensis]
MTCIIVNVSYDAVRMTVNDVESSNLRKPCHVLQSLTSYWLFQNLERVLQVLFFHFPFCPNLVSLLPLSLVIAESLSSERERFLREIRVKVELSPSESAFLSAAPDLDPLSGFGRSWRFDIVFSPDCHQRRFRRHWLVSLM